MNFVAFDPFVHLEYARTVLQVPISQYTKGIVAVDASGKPCAVVLLDNWTPTAVTGHVAIENPMAMRKLHKELFKYVFVDCGKKMLMGVTPSNNEKALKFNAHIGLTEIARIKDAYDVGVDQVVIQLLREDCKYITQLREVA
jgi:hypothetical protein